MGDRVPYGARRLKAKVLEILRNREEVCRAAAARYDGLPDEYATVAAATERCARLEVSHIIDLIEKLPDAGDRP